jgi:hypothetical protein
MAPESKSEPKAKASRMASMSASHKEALATGRNQGRPVKAYLEALSANKPKRGRKRTSESVQRQLEKVDELIASASPVKQLQLIQQKMDLQNELATIGGAVDISGLEAAFVAVAKEYSDRKGISYSAWRTMGVSAKVLADAGISR